MDSRPPAIEDPQEEIWLSGHLYTHQHLNQVISGFVQPLVVSLAREGRIAGFFFLRDGSDGPHVRLRLQAVPGAEDQARKVMEVTAHRFLARRLYRDGPKEAGEVSLVSSFRWIPFCPEIERYGGPSRFRLSLAFFTLSSVVAIEFLADHGSLPRAAQLARAFRLLLRQACGFAIDEVELFDLIRYGVDSWGESLPKAVEKGDRVAQSQGDVLLQMFEEEQREARSALAGALCGTASDLLVLGASLLSTAIEPADRETRARILGSQLHMTATRLGISNAEEAYLSRLLTATFRKARSQDRAKFSWLGHKPGEQRAEEAAAALAGLRAPALARLVDMPAIPEVL